MRGPHAAACFLIYAFVCCVRVRVYKYWWNLDGVHDPDYGAFHNATYGPDFAYQDFADMFTAELWNPDEWADIFLKSGAKYIVLTSKHHEGFTNWPSENSWNWNSVDVGPHRDLLGELTAAVRGKNLTMGLYHSLFEWFNPMYLQDKANGFNTSVFVDSKTMPELYDVVNNYQPDLIWSDGDWEAAPEYWQSQEFLAWLYNESPVKDTVVTNDRWGKGTSLTHGGYYSGSDRYNPGTLQFHKWENAFTLDSGTWGYSRVSPISDYLTIEDVLYQVVSTVACGGNALINVGPTRDGTIAPIFQERLAQLGAWLDVNGEAIYSTIAWREQNETAVSTWYTASGAANDTTFAIALAWPEDSTLTLALPKVSDATKVTMLGLDGTLPWTAAGDAAGLTIDLTAVTVDQLPSAYAWAFKLENVA